jgi:hypothetical protein
MNDNDYDYEDDGLTLGSLIAVLVIFGAACLVIYFAGNLLGAW